MSRFTTITMLFAVPFLAAGQDKVSGSIESETLVSSKVVTPQLNIYVQGPIGNSSKFGWSAWSLKCANFFVHFFLHCPAPPF
ncbi:MAG: hypothetical protein WCF77_05150 [Minisyncoccia bacterium]